MDASTPVTDERPVSGRAELRRQGRLLRETCSRGTHAEWKPASRKHDPIDLLELSNADRIPGLIAVRYGRMSQSPFAFFRGSAIVQARDLRTSPASGIDVHLCGDCHLMNFGGFATPERNLVFDINDFDETYPGPWEWDLKRLVASLEVAARYLDFGQGSGDIAVRAAVASYRERMSEYADRKMLAMWYTQIRLGDLLDHFKGDQATLTGLKKAAKTARGRTSESVFPKLTGLVDGKRRILDNPPLIYHTQQQQEKGWNERVQLLIQLYRKSLRFEHQALFDRYSYQDNAVKVVGIGSVGTRCQVVLFLADDDDPLFLQVKEARRSVLDATKGKSEFENQGVRVVVGQRLMQSATDIFLGSFRVPGGEDYYVRQLRDMKVSAELETFSRKMFVGYATICGWALARAHAKAGGAAMIAGYVGKSQRLDDVLVLYARAYADQVERDFLVFRKAIRSGRLKTDAQESEGLDFRV